MSWNKWILKDLRNCILCVIQVWSVFYSVRVYISLHFIPILLVKLSFRPLRVYIFGFEFFILLYVLNSTSS